MRRGLAATLIMSLLAGCATTRDHKGFIEESVREANPVIAPVRTQTSFSQSIVCMDRMLRDAGIRNVHITSKFFADPSGKAGTAVDQLIGTALSEMSVESHAFRWVENDVDQLKQDTVQSLGQMLIAGDGMHVRAPDIYVYGAVSYIDQNVSAKRKGFGIAIPTADVGLDQDVATSTISLDMRLGEFKTKSMFPGIHSSNTIATAKAGSGIDGGGKISKFGVTFSFGKDYTNGTGAAIRTLVELGVIELVGKWAKVPYWKCLAVDQAQPEFQRELQDWFGRLTATQRVKLFQAGLTSAGYYQGPVDGRESAALREALTRFQVDTSVTPTGLIDFASYERLIGEYVKVDSQGRFVRGEWLQALQEGSKADYRIAANKPSESTLVPDEPPKLEPITVSVVPSHIDRTYRVGEIFDLSISVSRGAYLRCYLQDEDNKIFQFYPNRFQTAEYVVARRAVSVPGEAGASGFVMAIEKEGSAKVLCLASDSNFSEAMPAAWKTAALQPIAALQSLDQVQQVAMNALGSARVGVSTVELRAHK